jgi:hypothetical protein
MPFFNPTYCSFVASRKSRISAADWSAISSGGKWPVGVDDELRASDSFGESS